MKQNSKKMLVHKSSIGDGSGTTTDFGRNSSISADSLTPEEKAYKDAVVPALLVRAYHLPGNKSWLSDWWQYMTNNHPVFGICWHHKYHPVRGLVRIFSLIGSMLFGLALTNIIYLAFVFSQTDYDKSYVEIHPNVTGTVAVDNSVAALSVTNGNIALWTIGAFLHAMFDNLIWAMAACSWCVSFRFDLCFVCVLFD